MDAPIDTFTHDNKVYDLTKVRYLIRSNPTFTIPIRELLWIHRWDHPAEDRVLKAKLRYPLLVCRWRGKWVVVDGLHRLERYRRMGIRVIPVKEVSQEVLERTRVV